MPRVLAELSEHRFISFDRTPIFYRTVSPGQNALATVVIVHGMGEHGGRYINFATYLASEGYHVVMPDLRGFGLSGGARGCVGSFEDYFGDLDAVLSVVRQEFSRPRIFLMGHSFGGLVAFHYAVSRMEAQFSGLILSSPNFGISIKVPAWRHHAALLLARFLPNLTQANRVNPTYLSHDKKSVVKYRTDPLIHSKISAGLYRQLTLQMQDSLKTAKRLRIPSLFMQAGDERVVSRPATERVFDAVLETEKTLETYEGYYHEILNEQNSGIVYERVLSWLDQQIKN